jgi:hypothetical protein
VAPGNDDKACDFCYSNPSFSVAFLYLVSISLWLKAGSRFCNEPEPEPGRDLVIYYKCRHIQSGMESFRGDQGQKKLKMDHLAKKYLK